MGGKGVMKQGQVLKYFSARFIAGEEQSEPRPIAVTTSKQSFGNF